MLWLWAPCAGGVAGGSPVAGRLPRRRFGSRLRWTLRVGELWVRALVGVSCREEDGLVVVLCLKEGAKIEMFDWGCGDDSRSRFD